MSNKAKRLRVLHVIPSVAPCRGGPSKAIIEMVAALGDLDIDAEIATTNDNGNTELDVELNKLIVYQGVPIRFFKRFSPNLNAIREFSYSKSFKVWLAKHIENYDLVHVHAIFSYCSSYAMSLARRRSIPYIVRPIGQLEAWSLEQSKLKKAIYLKVVEEANIEAASAVHFTADSERDQAIERFAKLKASVIPLGLDLPTLIPGAAKLASKYWQISTNTPCMVYLSRLHPKKGLELLLKALSKSELNDVQLLIAGGGDPAYVSDLKALCRTLKLENQCRFIGFIEGKQKRILYQRADLFCLTSHSENFGIAVLEAMANGATPLVSNEVALSSEIRQNALGYVCELDAEDISKNLVLAMSDLTQTRELGVNARGYVEDNFQWARIANDLRRLYQRVII